MKTKRLVILFVFYAAAACALMLRLWQLTGSEQLAAAAARQQSYTLTLAAQRPDFFDTNGLPLTGEGSCTAAVLFPGRTASWNAAAFLDEQGLAELEQGMQGDMPFALQLQSQPPQWALEHTVTLRQRLCTDSLLTHLIGYTDAAGSGVCGLERVFESYLAQNTALVQLRVTVDAVGRMVPGSEVQLIEPLPAQAGIRLTVDRHIQRAAEQAADRYMEKGAVVVLDVDSGDILAWVSRPDYDRNDVAAALSRTDGALLDRVDLAYPAGSVYKVAVAAAALEAGVDSSWSYTCSGSVEADGMRFQCNNGAAHGPLTMETALCCSCNCYFIALGQQIGAQRILDTARSLGIGSSFSLCNGFDTQAGSLPAASQLSGNAQLALHCFGQGSLLVTPLQVAVMTRTVAAGGSFCAPRLIMGVGQQTVPSAVPQQVLQQENAALLGQFLTSVVEKGTGKAGAPEGVTAAAKTGTAQTGQFDAGGKEKLIGWYSGWFPAQAPQYAVCVMMEDVTYGSVDAGPVFAAVAQGILAAQKLD